MNSNIKNMALYKQIFFISLLFLVACSNEQPNALKHSLSSVPNSVFVQEKDINADGEIDRKHWFDKEGEILESQLDEDYDGQLETHLYYKNGYISFAWVDSDLDGMGDIFFFYKNGVLTHTKRYVIEENKKLIEEIHYEYDYPKNRIRNVTQDSQTEFAHNIFENSGIKRVK